MASDFRKVHTFRTSPQGEFRGSAVASTWQGPKQKGEFNRIFPVKNSNKIGKKMADKNIKKEYDKRRMHVYLWLNAKEAAVLEKLMSEDDWSNSAGFIKDRIFAGKLDTVYARMIREAKKDDIEIVLRSLMTELQNSLGYLNYRFTYELDKIEKLAADDKSKELRQNIAKMREWKNAVQGRTEQISENLEAIFRMLKIRFEKQRVESVRYATDEMLEKATRDWNDTDSPEIHEIARRAHENLRRKQENEE